MDPKDAKRVAVIGAGTMGHSIAQVFAQAGLEVALMDVSRDVLKRAARLMESNLRNMADLGRVNSGEIGEILSRITTTTDLKEACTGVDFALEAVVEVPEVKQKVLCEMEGACPKRAILASNTSHLDIFQIVRLEDPRRFLTAHWYAPPHIIPLVEVAPGPNTSAEALAFTEGLLRRAGKLPMVLKEFRPGYIVNRIQAAIGQAIMELLQEGWTTPQEIDLAVKASIGVRIPILGLVQRMDFTGLQLVYDIQKAKGQVNPLIERLVREGRLGVSTSRGIYDYGGRSEEEILRKRDERFFRLLDFLDRINAWEPI